MFLARHHLDSTHQDHLTCYRRNIWRCVGRVTLPRLVSRIFDSEGRLHVVSKLALSITARESLKDGQAEIISKPSKEDKQQKYAFPPATYDHHDIILDECAFHDLDSTWRSVQFAWKRLLFRHATANNGRRKGHQQRFVVYVTLVGQNESGDRLRIAEIKSVPIIVRGRSPRHFSKPCPPLSYTSNNHDLIFLDEEGIRVIATSTEKNNHGEIPPVSLQISAEACSYESRTTRYDSWQSASFTRPDIKLASKILQETSTGDLMTVQPLVILPTAENATQIGIGLNSKGNEIQPPSNTDLLHQHNIDSVMKRSRNTLQQVSSELYEYFPLAYEERWELSVSPASLPSG